MRILFTTQPEAGHWQPLVPLAQAMESAGHEVVFATTPLGCTSIRRVGFQCVPVGLDESAEDSERIRDRLRDLSPEDHAAFFWSGVFAGTRAQRTLPDLMAWAGGWQPDAVVRETLEFAGYVTAEVLEIPHVALQISAWRPHMHRRIVAPLDRLRSGVGLLPDPDLRSLYRYLFLTTIPPGFQELEAELPATARNLRPVNFDTSGNEALPAWAGHLPEQPVVYASMGTAVNQTPGVFEAIIDALRDEPLSLIVTIGRNRDPAEFGTQPANVHVERYVPQSLIFPHADLIVTHGGSGTVMGALSHGLPMVIIPVAADQPHNARRCTELGVARSIRPEERTPVAIRAAVQDILNDPKYRQKAAQLQQEIRKMPGPDRAVKMIERLTLPRADGSHRPRPSRRSVRR